MAQSDAAYERMAFFPLEYGGEKQPVNILPDFLGFLKINAVLGFIACAFGRIVLEFHNFEGINFIPLCQDTTTRRIAMTDKDYLAAAAKAAAEQLADNAALHIPLDPDVADHMGAFREEALSLADVIEDGLFTLNEQGEVMYG
jgi:hypothetical protein